MLSVVRASVMGLSREPAKHLSKLIIDYCLGERRAVLSPRRRPEPANQIAGRSSPLVFRYVTELPRQAGRPMRRGKGGFARDREIYPDGSLVIAEWREPAGSDRLPVPSE
jgi:hypothetical protein